MKLQPNLIVKILEYGEEHADGGLTPCFPKLEGFTNQQVNEHLKLCEEYGYVEIEKWGALRNEEGQFLGDRYSIKRLTIHGHAQLEEVRRPTHRG